METFKLLSTSMFLLSYSTFIFSSFIHAQNLPQDYVNAHNSARSQVSVASVTWNTTLATYAQNYANQQRASTCSLTHSGGPYGENLAKGSNNFSGTTAVGIWVNEKQYYDYSTNSCTGGGNCLHYTQVVWHDSVQIGCARVQCTTTQTGNYFIICSYAAPGNYVGEKPY